MVLKNWYTENTINVYLPEQVSNTPGRESYAYSYGSLVSGVQHTPNPLGAPQSTLTAIVIEAIGNPPPQRFPIDATHAMGHFFGLPDTFAEASPTPASPSPSSTAITSTEFVDGSNSNTHGDLFSDTEADPYPGGSSGSPAAYCNYNNSDFDGKGQRYYPPVDNYMSKWFPLCACRFTQQQYNFMAWYILKKRMHLH